MSHSPSRFERGLRGASRSSTAHVIEELELYGYHPHEDEPDPRGLPEASSLEAALDSLYATLAETFENTRLEPDLADVLWSLTYIFHRKAERVQQQLDQNEDRQRAAQGDQDGSEVRSVELEKLLCQGLTILERRAVFEMLRDRAADHYESQTGSAWRPKTGSMTNHKAMTAALIDSRDFIAAKRKAETEVLVPPGPKVLFSGGVECNDHTAIWKQLDSVLARHAGMVLVHGGSPRGAEKIAACWADSRKVTQIAFKPDWTRDGKAAPFKRNDRMLEVMPIGVMVFPGSGITDNLADKARKMRLPLSDFRKQPAPLR